MKGVFVVGAGPAGIFATRQIALAGYEVCLFNRDIKPGGLAEYGIYPRKEKMKHGLRRQFAAVLALDNVHYFGHVRVGEARDLTIAELEQMQPAALVFACGAQGYKKLGLKGEEARGVYSAKDFVYHYNQLPPFAERDFSTGRRIAIVGAGNVAIDIARWLLEDAPERTTEEVVVVVRRGPLEIKFDRKEIECVEKHIDRDRLVAEIERVRERCAHTGENLSPESVLEHYFPALNDARFRAEPPWLVFRFLSSPEEIAADDSGRIERLLIAENDLMMAENGDRLAVANGKTAAVDVDTLIFAIGDRHDPALGLPLGPDGYATRPAAAGEAAYEVWDEHRGRPVRGCYVVGWARRASTGLVGIARHDAEVGAGKVLEFVRAAEDAGTLSAVEIEARLRRKGLRVVTKADLELLGRAEAREAEARHAESFKFADDDAMLQAMEAERERAARESALLAPIA
jgi:ferredoxin--NADP+ reductase